MALPPAEQILWGTGFENVLDFDYPVALDAPRTWRRPVPGSVRARNSAGITDAAVYGYDYLLAGRARWFDRGRWGGGIGLQAFLDWAGQGNAFRFVPDKTVPNFYVDNCFLESPFDEIDPTIEEADGSQSVDFVIRNQTKDFGEALRGIMFEYAPGMSLTDPVAASFTRATTAEQRGKSGLLFAAASGELRDRNYDASLRTTLLEATRQNLFLRSQDFNNASWTKTNATVTSAVDVAPDGTTTADRLIEAAGAGEHMASQQVTATADVKYALSAFAKAGTRGFLALTIRDVSAGTNRVQAWFNLTTGAVGTVGNVGTGSGAAARIEQVTNGYRCVLIGACNNGDTTPIGTVQVANADGTLNYTGDGTSYITVWGAQFENNVPVESSYVATTSAAVTRNTDALSWSYLYAPQALFAYVEFVERGSFQYVSTNSGYVSLGEASNAGFFLMPNNVTDYSFLHRRASDVSSAITLTPAIGDRIQLLGLLSGTGTAQIKGSKNGAAEVIGTQSGANALASAWFNQTLLVGRRFAADVQGFAAFIRVKIGPLSFGGVTRDTLAKVLAA